MKRRIKRIIFFVGIPFVLLTIYGILLLSRAQFATVTLPADTISASDIYNLVNAERQKASVPALTFDPLLIKTAQTKCDDMVANNYYEHTNPATGKQGYTYVFDSEPTARKASENLDQGQMPNDAQILSDWLNSPSHKAAMLDPAYTNTGIAVCINPKQPSGSHTVVQHFAVIH